MYSTERPIGKIFEESIVIHDIDNSSYFKFNIRNFGKRFLTNYYGNEYKYTKGRIINPELKRLTEFIHIISGNTSGYSLNKRSTKRKYKLGMNRKCIIEG